MTEGTDGTDGAETAEGCEPADRFDGTDGSGGTDGPGGAGVPALGVLSDLADRILAHAATELHPERTTLSVTGYADGDYRIEAYETLAIDHDGESGGTVTERAAVRYDRRLEWIRFHRYREFDGERTTAERRELEPYSDPIALAASAVETSATGESSASDPPPGESSPGESNADED